MDGVRNILGWKNSRWMVLWAATVFLAHVWLVKADDEIPISLDPSKPMEGEDVIMKPPKPGDNIVFCSWFRGQTPGTMKRIGTVFREPYHGSNQGSGFTGRETIYPNCFLRIRNLKLYDSSKYMLVEGTPGISLTGHIQLTISGVA